MMPSSLFRSTMLLSSTARAATQSLSAKQIYPSISKRTISSTRSFLSTDQSQETSSAQTPSPSSSATASEFPLEGQQNATTATSINAAPPSLRQYPYTIKTGTVTSVGLMDKTVRVAYRHREWDRNIRKYYPKTTTYLVSDPRNSLREGDVIEFSSGAPRSRRVRHVVERIIAPFGAEIADRPAVLSREEREAEKMQKRVEKLARKASRVAEAAAAAEEDVEAATRRYLQSKDHIGRIRSLVLERTAAAASA